MPYCGGIVTNVSYFRNIFRTLPISSFLWGLCNITGQRLPQFMVNVNSSMQRLDDVLGLGFAIIGIITVISQCHP